MLLQGLDLRLERLHLLRDVRLRLRAGVERLVLDRVRPGQRRRQRAPPPAAGRPRPAPAEIHDIPIEELERRRTLLLGVLLGNAGSDAVRKVAGRTGPHWAGAIVMAIPVTRLHQVNKVLGVNFVTKHGTKPGVLVLGKQVPLAIGGVGKRRLRPGHQPQR